MVCTQCGALMDQTDKNSFTGRVIREYLCGQCGHSDWEDDGVALWQVLHDSNEREIEAQAQQAADAPALQPAVIEPPAKASPSLWRRLIDFCLYELPPRSRR
jgi:hypothetical protein